MAEHCIFCKIIQGEMPAQIVYEDDQAVAFRDIAPAAPTHILIVPRRHIANLAEADEDSAALMGHLVLVAAHLARAEKLEADGYRLVANTGRNGGQSVWHLHWHLLGGRRLHWPPG